MQVILENIKNNKNFLFGIFVLALVVRLIFFSLFLKDHNNKLNVDSWQYSLISNELVHGNGFSLGRGPQFYRLPGYPLFLAMGHKLFENNEQKTLLLQIVFASLIPILFFLLALTFFPKNLLLAKASSLLSVAHIGLLTFSGIMMTETFFTLFFLIFSIFFFSQCFFLSGIFLGIASLFRPVGHYVIAVSVVLLLIFSVSKAKDIVFLFSGWLSVLFWWVLRNYLLTGYIFLHTLPGTHFLHHLVSRVVMEKQEVSYSQASREVFGDYEDLVEREERLQGRVLLDIEKCNLAEKITLKNVLNNVTLFIKHAFINMFKTSFSLYSSELLFIDSGGVLPEYDRSRSWVDIVRRFLFPVVSNKLLLPIIYVEMLLFLLLLIGFFGWLFRSLCGWEWALPFKILSFVGLFIFISCACGFARLRLPVEPFVIIFSLSFWLGLTKKGKRLNEC